MELELGNHHVLRSDHVFKLGKLRLFEDRHLKVSRVEDIAESVGCGGTGESAVHVEGLVEDDAVVLDGVKVTLLLSLVDDFNPNVPTLGLLKVSHGLGVHEADGGLAFEAVVPTATNELTQFEDTLSVPRADSFVLVVPDISFRLRHAFDFLRLTCRSGEVQEAMSGPGQGTGAVVPVEGHKARHRGSGEGMVPRGGAASQEERLKAEVGALHEGFGVLLDQAHNRHLTTVLHQLPVGDGDGSGKTMRLDLDLGSPLRAGEVEKFGAVKDASASSGRASHDGALDGRTTVDALTDTRVRSKCIEERGPTKESLDEGTLEAPVGRI